MVEHETATIEDRRFVFVKDVDGRETPVFIGSIVRAIRSGAVPGFDILNEIERDTVNEILVDAEHHHRARLTPDEWERHIVIEKRIRSVRIRLGLSLHYETPEHCPYLSPQIVGEGVGL